jgi:hypothetical protein
MKTRPGWDIDGNALAETVTVVLLNVNSSTSAPVTTAASFWALVS